MIKSGSITIKDIARELNISNSTVSRALANSDLVRPETKLAVKALAEKYDYAPSYQALSLLNKKTYTLGVIVPKIVHEFFSKVIRGIEEYAMRENYNIILSPSHDSQAREIDQVNTLITGKVDALIVCISKETADFSHFENALNRKLPVIFFDSINPSFQVPNVVLNDQKAGHDAVQHLIDQGCQRIAYLGGPENTSVNRARFQGYLDSLKNNGITADVRHFQHAEKDDSTTGRFYMRKLIEADPKIDGLFASTDILAIGAMKEIKSTGRTVPEDIAVIGFSNWSLCTVCEPTLSSMSQPGFEIGMKAAEIAIDSIGKPDTNPHVHHIVESELVVRESSLRL